jgi:hypothetical protein
VTVPLQSDLVSIFVSAVTVATPTCQTDEIVTDRHAYALASLLGRVCDYRPALAHDCLVGRVASSERRRLRVPFGPNPAPRRAPGPNHPLPVSRTRGSLGDRYRGARDFRSRTRAVTRHTGRDTRAGMDAGLDPRRGPEPAVRQSRDCDDDARLCNRPNLRAVASALLTARSASSFAFPSRSRRTRIRSGTHPPSRRATAMRFARCPDLVGCAQIHAGARAWTSVCRACASQSSAVHGGWKAAACLIAVVERDAANVGVLADLVDGIEDDVRFHVVHVVHVGHCARRIRPGETARWSVGPTAGGSVETGPGRSL